MAGDYHVWAEQIQRLHGALTTLEPAASAIGVPSPQGQEWFELLRHKLLPQVVAPPLLVVAVAGGTNIGKSLVFNHLAGENASGVSPLAAGTKHPVCLVPPGWDDGPALAGLFEGFELRRWQSAEDPLQESAEHVLYWRVGRQVPPRLLLLDTPDIDSTAEVNWQRADTVRQAADVLIAVLTQQKYNDAAVKRFFRKAAEADKPVIIVFNQCELEDDRPFWPVWLDTFREATGVEPALVYVVPFDRSGAKALRLPFYAVGGDGRGAPGEPQDLRAELASMHFDAIKIRTLRGALEGVLDRDRGAASYLNAVRQASGGFAAAAQSLSSTQLARVRWPVVPARLLVDEIRGWWDERRSAWSARVHGFYRVVGHGIVWPIRAAWQSVNGPAPDPFEQFHTRERQAIVEAIESLLDFLERLSLVGNETLRPRLALLLTGDARGRLLRRVQAAHDALPDLDDDYRKYLRSEMDRWSAENPRAAGVWRALDQAAAIARPAITLSLVVSGGVLAGDLLGQAAAHVAGHTAGQLAAEAAVTGGVTATGEAVVIATGEGIKQTSVRLFGRLQQRYAELRAGWLAAWLERELLGELLAELRRGAGLAQGQAMREVETSLALLARSLDGRLELERGESNNS
jgi:50S ribosome-binding GTPase